ncbi:two-component sensor histidine kinase [Hymenobacter sp. BT523]|nr:two-component sensor histidine kinase [Hymenobacter sp. BT523]
MTGLWAVRALYDLFNVRPGRVYAGLWLWYGGVVLALLLAPFHPMPGYLWGAMSILFTAEELRLTVRAVRQRRRGAWIIAVGFAGGLLAALGYLGVRLLAAPLLVENLCIVAVFVLPALGISLFLAREFALDAGLLQVKLAEVERLSAQTIAQEQEKQALLAQQNETLETQVAQRTGELQHSLTDLRATQAQLIQKEKMASLGELTAGIAHEIQNPLNFVNNFSEVSTELVEELQEALAARDTAEAAELASDVAQNLGKITEHGKRAAAIVKGMLEHSRTSTGERAPTDLNQLCDEYLRLAYQGLRAKDKTFNAKLETDFAPGLPLVEAAGADLGRVLLNLFGNAFYAVQKRQQAGEADYGPTVRVSTKQVGNQVEIRVSDNGPGIPESVKAKIFQPFFTTKPTGEGTGLGLSLSHDIIAQGHGGTLTVASQEGKFTEFLISLPIN